MLLRCLLCSSVAGDCIRNQSFPARSANMDSGEMGVDVLQEPSPANLQFQVADSQMHLDTDPDAQELVTDSPAKLGVSPVQCHLGVCKQNLPAAETGSPTHSSPVTLRVTHSLCQHHLPCLHRQRAEEHTEGGKIWGRVNPKKDSGNEPGRQCQSSTAP